MPNSRSPYRSYLLRLWCDSASSDWRASVQNIRSGETRHFAQPKELWAYLQAEMANDYSPVELEVAIFSRTEE